MRLFSLAFISILALLTSACTPTLSRWSVKPDDHPSTVILVGPGIEEKNVEHALTGWMGSQGYSPILSRENTGRCDYLDTNQTPSPCAIHETKCFDYSATESELKTMSTIDSDEHIHGCLNKINGEDLYAIEIQSPSYPSSSAIMYFGLLKSSLSTDLGTKNVRYAQPTRQSPQ